MDHFGISYLLYPQSDHGDGPSGTQQANIGDEDNDEDDEDEYASDDGNGDGGSDEGLI